MAEATPAGDGDGLIPRDVRQEHKTVDQAIGILMEHVWPVAAVLIGAGAASSWVSTEVGEATTFWGIFFATLSWSLGVAIITAATQIQDFVTMQPMALLAVVGLVLVLSSSVATAFAVGTLDQDPCTVSTCGSPPETVLAYIGQAVVSFGFLGFMLGTVTGILCGLWAVRIIKHHAS